MREDFGGAENGTGHGHWTEVNEGEELLALQSQVVGLSCMVEEMRTMQEQHRLEIHRSSRCSIPMFVNLQSCLL
jgi:hypothetical protein